MNEAIVGPRLYCQVCRKKEVLSPCYVCQVVKGYCRCYEYQISLGISVPRARGLRTDVKVCRGCGSLPCLNENYICSKSSRFKGILLPGADNSDDTLEEDDKFEDVLEEDMLEEDDSGDFKHSVPTIDFSK
ncbi:26S proteasome complex subunit SEM1 [Candidatus Uabimicrobium sp. HlEnr_7]|uniref:26S proteasome complex subunit SEM1 n=1 Tax=Candidatus Uabimicrobium helgolandensis TaxID=3095367 RepID=UPI003557A3DA